MMASYFASETSPPGAWAPNLGEFNGLVRKEKINPENLKKVGGALSPRGGKGKREAELLFC